MAIEVRYRNSLSTLVPSKQFKFPGGEIGFQLLLDGEPGNILAIDVHQQFPGGVDIRALLRNSDDVLTLIMAVDAVRRATSATYPIYLTIPYFPYARQDRVCNVGEALACKVMADLINSLKVDGVTIHDPHSEVVGAVLSARDREVEIRHQSEFFKQALVATEGGRAWKALENRLIVAPDAGALKKVRKVTNDFAICDKIRRLSDGAILGVEVIKGDVQGKNCMILDDICDGGRTFIETAASLKAAGAASVWLYVTHGIFSQGFDKLKESLDGIITTDSYAKPDACPGFVHVLDTRLWL